MEELIRVGVSNDTANLDLVTVLSSLLNLANNQSSLSNTAIDFS